MSKNLSRHKKQKKQDLFCVRFCFVLFFSMSHDTHPLPASCSCSVFTLLLCLISLFFFLFPTSSLSTQIKTRWRRVRCEISETVCQWELGWIDESEWWYAAKGCQLGPIGCFTPCWLTAHWPVVGLSMAASQSGTLFKLAQIPPACCQSVNR